MTQLMIRFIAPALISEFNCKFVVMEKLFRIIEITSELSEDISSKE